MFVSATFVEHRHGLRVNALQRDLKNVPDSVKSYCSFDDHGARLHPTIELVLSKRIVFVTCASARLLYSCGVERGSFTDIFIDEAGHSLEAECMIPLSAFADDRTKIVWLATLCNSGQLFVQALLRMPG